MKLKYQNINNQQLRLQNSLNLLMKALSSQYNGNFTCRTITSYSRIVVELDVEAIGWDCIEKIEAASDKAPFSYEIGFYTNVKYNESDNTIKKATKVKITIW